MKTLNSLYRICLWSAVLGLVLWLTGGCSDTLRFAPTESQKQAAELTNQLAVKVNAEGAVPASPASQELCQGTQASLTYIGRAKVPPDPAQFPTIVSTAATDAVLRPQVEDVFAAAGQGLSLATQLALLFGVGGAGFGGKKVLDWLTLAKEKNKALEEIVKGNELMKTWARDAGKPELIEDFKKAQDIAQASASTKVLVAELKS